MQRPAKPSTPVRFRLAPPTLRAWVVKLVDTGDLKSPDLNGRAGSSPAPGTMNKGEPLMKTILALCACAMLSAAPTRASDDKPAGKPNKVERAGTKAANAIERTGDRGAKATV